METDLLKFVEEQSKKGDWDRLYNQNKHEQDIEKKLMDQEHTTIDVINSLLETKNEKIVEYVLEMAIKNDRFDIVHQCKKEFGITNADWMLEFAAIRDRMDIVCSILKEFPNVEDDNNGIMFFNAMRQCATHGHLEIVEKFLNRCTKKDTKFLQNVLMGAVESGSLETVQRITKWIENQEQDIKICQNQQRQGANLFEQIHRRAVDYGHSHIVQYSLDSGLVRN